MELKQQFTVKHDVGTVWQALSDTPFAVRCLPGAELDPSEDDIHYKGRMKVKLGPLSAAFAGDAVVQRDDETKVGTVNFTGTDTRSNSRAKATMTYRVLPGDDVKDTRVDITADVALTGALAQFGRAGIIQDVANRLTAIFADNLQQRLNDSQDTVPIGLEDEQGMASAAAQRKQLEAAQELRALPLIWSILRARTADMLRRLADWVEGRNGN